MISGIVRRSGDNSSNLLHFHSLRNFVYLYIRKRHTIHNDTSYNEVVVFLMDSIGSCVSARNIAYVLTANGKKIDNKTVSKYIDTLVTLVFGMQHLYLLC